MSQLVAQPGVRWRLGAGTRKGLLVLHIASAGAWLGMDLAMAVLIFTVLTTDNTTTKATSFQALELVAVWPLLATGLVCLASGVLLGLGSKYGLARFGNGLENRAFAVEDAQVREYGAASVAIGALAQETSFQGRDNSGRVGGLPRSFQIGVSSKWTVLPVLARPRRWVRGTSRPCSNGCLAVSSRAAWLASAPSRRLARALMPGPVGVPRAVDGATSMTGLRPIRLVFPAFSKLRTTARSPSTAMLTGVPTGRPPRR